MRTMLILPAALMGLAFTTAAFAQTGAGAGMGNSASTPTATTGGNAAPVPPNSVPHGSITGAQNGGGTTHSGAMSGGMSHQGSTPAVTSPSGNR